MSRTPRRAFALIALLSFTLISVACSDKVVTITGYDESPNQNQPGHDQSDEELDLIERSLFTNCAASGVASGDGYHLTHCTGPADINAETLSGSGFTLQAGAFRQLPPAR